MDIKELINLYIKAQEDIKDQIDLLLEVNQLPSELPDSQPNNS